MRYEELKQTMLESSAVSKCL